MKDLLILVGTGFEDVELIGAIDVFDRQNLSFDLISVENKDQVMAQRFAFVKTKRLDQINPNNYRGLFLPGGQGHKILLKTPQVLRIVRKFVQENKVISAICAAPEILKQAGVIDNVRITAYPGYATGEYNTGNDVEIANNFVTGKDFRATLSFADQVVRKIKG